MSQADQKSGAMDEQTMPKPTRVHIVGETAIVVGNPQRNWDEESEDAHNCDVMGCGSFGPHVLFRLPVTIEPAKQPEAGGAVAFMAPADIHPATLNLVARFAGALAEKLAKAEQKYGYSEGWASPVWMDECRTKLMEHIAKGDPRDVAAYCAFLWHHGASTSPAKQPEAGGAGVAPKGWALVPERMSLSAESIADIEFMCGGPGLVSSTQDGDRWLDGILWVGETEGDNGEKYWGLNIACEDLLEEGSVPVVEFERPNTAPADAPIDTVPLEHYQYMGKIVHDMTVCMQAAWIQWQHGLGAEDAMKWIHNRLWGPGLIPDEDEPYGKDAQAYYDANRSDPFPLCPCGRPSNILWMGKGFCSNACYASGRKEPRA